MDYQELNKERMQKAYDWGIAQKEVSVSRDIDYIVVCLQDQFPELTQQEAEAEAENIKDAYVDFCINSAASKQYESDFYS